jgi:hypothetical protein
MQQLRLCERRRALFDARGDVRTRERRTVELVAMERDAEPIQEIEAKRNNADPA